MIIRFLFLSLLLFIGAIKCGQAQNLISDWSIEQYSFCPTGLAFDMWLPTWISVRGNPDYFHTCSNDLSPINNPAGWQQPRTGEAIVGVVTYSAGLQNAREYPGVELIQPLEIDEFYDVSFWVSLAHSPNDNIATRVSDNLGILLLTTLWLSPNELGTVPNFAHVNADTLVTDTTNWVQVKGVIEADSAYRYITFGNFFADSLTYWEYYDENNQEGNLAYYFFDDFCVVPLGGDCSQVLNVRSTDSTQGSKIYPNPASTSVSVENSLPMRFIRLLDLAGGLCLENKPGQNVRSLNLPLDSLSRGVYILEIETEKGLSRHRLVVNP